MRTGGVKASSLRNLMRLPTPLPQAAAFLFSAVVVWADPGDYTRRNETFATAATAVPTSDPPPSNENRVTYWVTLSGEAPPLNKTWPGRRVTPPPAVDVKLSPRNGERSALDGLTPLAENVMPATPLVFPPMSAPLSPLNGKKSALQPRRGEAPKPALVSKYQDRLRSAPRVKIGRVSTDGRQITLGRLNRFATPSSQPAPESPAIPVAPAGAESAPLP